MKKLVDVICFDKSGKYIYSHVLSTKTIKGLAGIKRIAELEDDAYAQVQLDDSIVVATKHFAKEYADTYGTIIDHILIYNDYTNTVEKYSIR